MTAASLPQCFGKQAWSHPQDAHRAVRKHGKRREAVVVYRCGTCGLLHITHATRRLR